MESIRRILVAIKNPQSRNLSAVKKAAQLARALDAEVCLFHALVDPIYMDLPFDGPSAANVEEQNREARLFRLERLARFMRREHVKVTTVVEWDFPSHEAIIRAADRFGADLVIAESHPNHVTPWLLHFTDWELLRHCPQPLLLIKNRHSYRRPSVLAAIDPGHPADKPARLDAAILRCGALIASALRGCVHAVHAYDPLPSNASELGRPAAVARAQAEASRKALSAVDRVLKRAAVPVRRRHVEGGFAIDVIARVARNTDAGILVMGAISRAGLKGLIVGNTAERMIDRLSCDLLIVKPPGFRSQIAAARRGVRFAATPRYIATALVA